MNNQQKNLLKDVFFIILSVFIAIALIETGAIENLISLTQGVKFIGNFVAGMLFVSIFTIAPATAVLVEIARADSIISLVLIGGMGAALGDLIIFKLVKNRLAQDFSYLFRLSKFGKFKIFFKFKIFRRLTPLIGALIIASPLPDEVGLTMLGLSKMKTRVFIPLSFMLNALGILVIGLIAKSL